MLRLGRTRYSIDDVEIASEADLSEIQRFSYSICVEEQGKTHIPLDHDQGKLTDPLDGTAVHYVLRHHGAISAYFRVHDVLPDSISRNMPLPTWLHGETVAFMSRLMVSQSLRGSNAAITLLLAAYRDGLHRGRVAAVSHVRKELVSFYERLGLYRGEEYLIDESVGLYTVMILMLNDIEQLRSKRSPLLSVYHLKVESLERVVCNGF